MGTKDIKKGKTKGRSTVTRGVRRTRLRALALLGALLAAAPSWAQELRDPAATGAGDTAGSHSGAGQSGASAAEVRTLPGDTTGRLSYILPSPEPFTLNAYDALHAAALIRRVGLLRICPKDGQDARDDINSREAQWGRTLAARSVSTIFVEEDQVNHPWHPRRYDVRVNGEPLPWNRAYIEYGGRMANLRLLFTYRNQRPPAGLQYFGERCGGIQNPTLPPVPKPRESSRR